MNVHFLMTVLVRAVVMGMLFVIGNNATALEIVSIGGACNVARAARHNNMRNNAYPFDWLITPMQALKAAFEDDFAQILVKDQMRESENGTFVVDGYGFTYIHDFPTVRYPTAPEDGEIMPVHQLLPQWCDSIDIVKAKFTRRLQRLLDLLHSGQPVALVRYNEMDQHEAEEFIQLLRKKFPDARLVLVVIGSSPEFKQPWNLPHIYNVYIDEKDFSVWDGPAWTEVLQMIVRLNPTTWSVEAAPIIEQSNADKQMVEGLPSTMQLNSNKWSTEAIQIRGSSNSNKWSDVEIQYASYVLTSPSYDPGLFSVFNSVIGALDYYDRGLIAGLRVDFGNHGWYFDIARGNNWWDYYFEPVALGKIDDKNGEQLFPTYQKIMFAYTAQFEMLRERAHELIQKYVHVRASIAQKIDAFWNQHCAGNFVIGVHYRGTDKLSDADPVSYDTVIEQVQAVLANHSGKDIKIFVATDDAHFATYIQATFPQLVVMRDALRSDNSIGVHMRTDLDPYQKGEEVVIDCLLLSRCSALIKMASNVSDCSLQFNPHIPVIKLNRSYSE